MNTTIGRIAIKKTATYSSSVCEQEIDFRKLVDKLEQAELPMKLEETDDFELQNISNPLTFFSQINNLHDSDSKLAGKPNYSA